MDVENAARNLGIGRDELLEVLELFLEISWEDFLALKEALETGDQPRAAAAAHSLKGAALNLGLQELADLARTLELADKDGVLLGAEGQLEALREKLCDLAQAVHP
jgi:HPt (histidine-containing phosphotransfer) domain-containing protein|uniref:Hpt domain-containing protein n=1 Tax=Desulfobacca acetoxidans TaxID=60893 RepID=A0A7V6DQM8_9BACT